jgi:GDP-L-fucose synthase
LREFLHVDDLADALVFIAKHYTGELPINIGSGEELSIAELSHEIATVAGFKGQIVFDPSRPDGTPRKLVDSSRLSALGWKPGIPLRNGLESTYDWFTSSASCDHRAKVAQ